MPVTSWQAKHDRRSPFGRSSQGLLTHPAALGRWPDRPKVGASGGMDPGGECFGKQDSGRPGLREVEALGDRGFGRLSLQEAEPVKPREGFAGTKRYREGT